MKIEQFKFLTTNEQKARDFKNAGFAVENNPNEVSEILSDNVELVALYKAFDTNVENSIVEDTCLNIENSYFLGTQIKDYWQELEKYWIKYYKDKGCDLLNHTEGGEGQSGRKLSKEHKDKISKNNKKTNAKLTENEVIFFFFFQFKGCIWW